MIVELIVIGCVGVLAYIAGNITGWTTGKKLGEEKARFEALINRREHTENVEHEPFRCLSHSAAMRNYLLDSIDKEEVIDHLSRQSLAFSQKQKHWIKVYDAEVIE
jgi:membrane protein YqaA with SNARE-associated domain